MQIPAQTIVASLLGSSAIQPRGGLHHTILVPLPADDQARLVKYLPPTSHTASIETVIPWDPISMPASISSHSEKPFSARLVEATHLKEQPKYVMAYQVREQTPYKIQSPYVLVPQSDLMNLGSQMSPRYVVIPKPIQSAQPVSSRRKIRPAQHLQYRRSESHQPFHRHHPVSLSPRSPNPKTSRILVAKPRPGNKPVAVDWIYGGFKHTCNLTTNMVEVSKDGHGFKLKVEQLINCEHQKEGDNYPKPKRHTK